MGRRKVWITGAGGLIGHQLVRLAPGLAPHLEVVALTRDQLDLTDRAEVERRFGAERPALVVHCAGLTRSPACEADPDLARRLNVDVADQLSRLGEGLATLVFFSTDLVFDGSKGAYVETDPVRPLSVYAASKADGERAVLARAGNVVLRTSLNYGVSPTGDRAFNEELLRTARAGGRPRLFTDEYRCPLAAEVTARATWELLAGPVGSPRLPGERPAGIYHLAGAERLSRWDIGELLATVHPELRGALERASLQEYRGAPRPPDTTLDCTRIAGWLATPLPAFSAWLRREAAAAR